MICVSAGRAGDGAQQPVPPGPGLFQVAGVQQRIQREGGVAQPAIAIVPVAHAAQLLRQRGGGGRHDAARRGVGQGLERDQRAQHLLAPWP